MPVSTVPLVEMLGISKTFPGVKALQGVDFTVMPGEVHVLFGENGAGKSTLISILSGVYPQTSGTLRISGREVNLDSVAVGRRNGIAAVFQEFSLVPTMSVAENIYLGAELRRGPFVDKRAMRSNAQQLFENLGFPIDVRQPVVRLSRAQQQMTEIAKAIHFDARILILDEPTASLTERETETLFRIIEDAKARGVGIVYISHRMQEFARIADRITVLRDGRLIGTVQARETSSRKLVEMMTGRAVDEIYPEIAWREDGDVLLSAKGLCAEGVRDVSVEVRRGEVLGVAGLVGSGKSRLWRAIMGLARTAGGQVKLKGIDVTSAQTRRMVDGGVFYLPPDRKSEGLMLSATTRQNIDLGVLRQAGATGFLGGLSPSRLRAISNDIAEKVGLPNAYLSRVIANLSGGNQQKALFGKGFGRDYDVYILDEPTVGVDMGTRAALYRLIKDMAEAGKSVVIISSDLPEVLHLAHRVIVFSSGRITGTFVGDEIKEEAVLGSFFSNEERVA
jgi:ribose transport system ATP-binding protein